MDHKQQQSLNEAIIQQVFGSSPPSSSTSSIDEDNTAAVAKQVKKAVKEYTSGKLVVRSKGGKSRFIMVRADKIDNKLREMMADVMYPKANIHDRDDISYGNISSMIISAGTDAWIEALGLKEEEAAVSSSSSLDEAKSPVKSLGKEAKAVLAMAINMSLTDTYRKDSGPVAHVKNLEFFGDTEIDAAIKFLDKNSKKLTPAGRQAAKEIVKTLGESVELDEAFDMKKMLKIFNKLKKNDTIKIKYDSSISRGKEFQTFVVTSPKRPVGKKGVERVIMKHVDNPTGVKYTLYNRDGSVSLAIGDMAASMTDIKESVHEHSFLDESLVLASDNLNAVKKTAEKLSKQSPDLTYYVVKHNERYMKGMKYAYYEVYQSVDMHLVRGKVKKIVGYGAKVDMRESVLLDEGTSIAPSVESRKKVTKVLKKKGIGFHTSKGDIMVNPKNLIAAKSALNKEFGGDFEKKTGMKLKATKKVGISDEVEHLDESASRETETAKKIAKKGKKLGDWVGKSYYEYEGNLWILGGYGGDAVNRGPIDRAKKTLNKILLKNLKF